MKSKIFAPKHRPGIPKFSRPKIIVSLFQLGREPTSPEAPEERADNQTQPPTNSMHKQQNSTEKHTHETHTE